MKSLTIKPEIKSDTNTLWLHINLKRNQEAEWYQKMNAKLNNYKYVEQPISFKFRYILK